MLTCGDAVSFPYRLPVLTVASTRSRRTPVSLQGGVTPTCPSRPSDRGGLLTCGDVEQNPGPPTLAGQRSRRDPAKMQGFGGYRPPADSESSSASAATSSSSSSSSSSTSPERDSEASATDVEEHASAVARPSRDAERKCPGCRGLTLSRTSCAHLKVCLAAHPERFRSPPFFYPLRPSSPFTLCPCGEVFHSTAQSRPLECKACRRTAHAAAAPQPPGDAAAPLPPPSVAAPLPFGWDELGSLAIASPAHRFVPLRLREPVARLLLVQLQNVDAEEALKRLWAFPALVLHGPHTDVLRRAKLFAAGAFQELVEERRKANAERQPRAPAVAAMLVDDDLDDRLPLSTDAAEVPDAVLRRVVELARSGALSRANAALSQAQVATGDDALVKLKALHPEEAEPVCPRPSTAPPVLTSKLVARALRSFRLGTAAGPSGFSADLLRGLTSRCSELLDAVTAALQPLVGAELPVGARRFVFGARLVALAKKNGGVRPIGCGDVLRRTAAKALCILAKKDLGRRCQDYAQVGVGMPGGAEAPPIALQHLVRQHPDGWIVIKIDYSNAFNTLSRQALVDTVARLEPRLAYYANNAYGSHSFLFWGETRLWSQCGVQQGDPLGPAFFSLTLGASMAGSRRTPFEVWYLDDGTIAGPADDTVARFGVIRDCAATVGLAVNMTKCEAIALDPAVPQGGAIPWVPRADVELLGIPCAESESGSPPAVSKAVKKVVEHLHLLRQVADADAHVAYALARSCSGFAALNFLLRGHGPDAQYAKVDDAIMDLCAALAGTPVVEAATRAVVHMPAKQGGLGLRSLSDSATAARIGALLGARHLVPLMFAGDMTRAPRLEDAANSVATHAAFPPRVSAVYGTLVAADPAQIGTRPQRALNKALEVEAREDWLGVHAGTTASKRLRACSALGASAYLTHPERCGAWLSPEAFSVTAALRLGLPVVTPGAQCGNCAGVLDAEGYHALTCMHGGVRHRPHNALRDFVYGRAAQALMQPLREYMCFPGKADRMDVVLRSGCQGKQVLLDFAVTHALRADAPEGPEAAANAYSETTKWRRYAGQVDAATQVFTPVVVDTFGGVCHGARKVLGNIATASTRRAGEEIKEGRARFFGALNSVILTGVAELVLAARRTAV